MKQTRVRPTLWLRPRYSVPGKPRTGAAKSGRGRVIDRAAPKIRVPSRVMADDYAPSLQVSGRPP